MRKVISVILGGGQGARLFPLTQYRSKPAVPIGGKYRLIDIPISNCIHSGVDKMFVLTQFNSASLNRHVGLTYRFDNFGEGFATTDHGTLSGNVNGRNNTITGRFYLGHDR